MRAGQVPRFTDLWKYIADARKMPEVKLTPKRSVWVIQLSGEHNDLLAGEAWIDETCPTGYGQTSFLATGPVRDLATGRIKRGYYVGSSAPPMSLPTLAP